jgi:hypothetical protein
MKSLHIRMQNVKHEENEAVSHENVRGLASSRGGGQVQDGAIRIIAKLS